MGRVKPDVSIYTPQRVIDKGDTLSILLSFRPQRYCSTFCCLLFTSIIPLPYSQWAFLWTFDEWGEGGG